MTADAEPEETVPDPAAEPVSVSTLRRTSRRHLIAYVLLIIGAVAAGGMFRSQQQVNQRNIARLAADEKRLQANDAHLCALRLRGWRVDRDIIIGVSPVVVVTPDLLAQFPLDQRPFVKQVAAAALSAENRALLTNRARLLTELGGKPDCAKRTVP